MNLNLNIKVSYTDGQFNTWPLPQFPLPTPPRPFINDLIVEAEKLWCVPPGTVKSRNRQAWAIAPRHAVAYAARRMTKRSYPEIGHIMGGFDHSTIIHAERRAKEKRAEDPEYRAQIAQLMWNVRMKRRGL